LIKQTILNRKPDLLVFFGDVFNSPTSISSPVISVFSKIIGNLCEIIPTVFIVGNHDDIDNKKVDVKFDDTSIKVRSSLLSPFAYYPNVIVADEPSVFKIDDGVEVAFVPYSTNIIENLKQLKFSPGTKRILMGHFDIKDTFYMVKMNDQVVTVEFPTAKELINDYNLDLVLLGHIHEPVDYVIDNKLVKYIGSCRNIDFKNSGESKGIYILDTNNLNLEFIENANGSIYKTFKTFDQVNEYCRSKDPEILARTHIKFTYSNNNEVQKISKLKEFFKSIKFERALLSASDNAKTASIEIENFKEMLENNLITKDSLIDFALQFNQPNNKETVLKVFKYVNM